MTAAVTELTKISIDERYRLLVDNITDYAIFMLDANGYVSSWNAGVQDEGEGMDAVTLEKATSRSSQPRASAREQDWGCQWCRA